MKTAEKLFKETVAEYNKKATPMNEFSFSKEESKIFVDMMQEYAKQTAIAQREACADHLSKITNIRRSAVIVTPLVTD